MPSRSPHWIGGSTRAHRRAREVVLARAGGVCQLSIQGVCTRAATEAHHTLGRGQTGDDPQWMIASCKACNLHVGDPTRFDPTPEINDQWWLNDHDVDNSEHSESTT
jgi:hypothetical protein